MDAVRETDNTQAMKDRPNPGLLRPPITFLCAILLGIALNRAWTLNLCRRVFGCSGPLLRRSPCCSSFFPTENSAELALRYREASVPLRSCEQVRTGSVVIPSMCPSFCLCSDCQFG